MTSAETLAFLLEAVHIVALLGVGALVVPRGTGGAVRPALALLTGVALHVVVGGAVVAAVAFGAPAPPWLLTPLLVVLAALVARRASRDASTSLRWSDRAPRPSALRAPERGMLVAGAVLAALAVAVRALRLASIGPDAVEYLAGARLLGSGRADLLVSAASYLERRSVALQTLNAPLAALDLGGAFVLGPGALLAVLVLVGVLVARLVAVDVAPPWPQRLSVLAVLALVTLERMLAAATKGNGHQVVAGTVLLAVAVALLAAGPPTMAVGPRLAPRPAAVLATLALAALVLLRPEGALLALLLLVPTVPSLGRTRELDRWPWYGLGTAVIVWQTTLVVAHRTVGLEVGSRNVAQLAFGVGALTVPFVLDRAPERLRASVPVMATAVLGAAVIVHAIVAPAALRRSVGATAINLVEEGRWGGAVPLLVVIAVVAVLAELRARARREPFGPWWSRVRFPVLAFPVLGIVLGLLRGSPFRIGAADSLNRMWVHIVPLVVLLGVAGVSDARGASSGATGGSPGAPGVVRGDSDGGRSERVTG